MPWMWKTPTLADAWVFLLVGVTGSVGQLLLNQAFRYGEVSMLAPLDYTGLLWAILYGFLIWHDVPTWVMLVGAAVVVAANLYILHRETRLKPTPARAGTPPAP